MVHFVSMGLYDKHKSFSVAGMESALLGQALAWAMKIESRKDGGKMKEDDGDRLVS